MHVNRIAQIRDLQVHNDRTKIETSIIELNVEITKKNKDIAEALERYITEFITSDEFSLEFIQSLIMKLKLYKWIEIQTDISISRMLFSLIYNTVLLPDYLNEWQEEKNYKELKELIDNYLADFDRKINKLVNENYCLELWNPYDLVRESKTNDEKWEDLVNFRMFYIWEGFWNNVFEYDENINGYAFKIPLDLNSKLNKSKRKLNPEKIKAFVTNVVNEYAIKTKCKPFYVGYILEKDINHIYGNDETIPYFTISLTKEWDFKDADILIDFVVDLIKINNHVINELSKEFGLTIKKHINLFSSWESLLVSKVIPEEWVNKFSQLKLSDKQKVTLKDVGWQEEAKKEIQTIIDMIKYDNIVDSWGAKHSKWIIFEGPSGTGKTLLAKVIANEVNAEVYNIKLTDIQSSAMINEWANNIKELFAFLRKRAKKINKKIIVILDELDALFKKRNGSVNSSWEDTKIVNTFLTEMSGLEDLENVIFVGTTNLLDSIDEAVIRSWRMETKIKVWLPDLKAKIDIYKIHLSKLPQKAQDAFSEVNIEEVAKKSDWLSWANIEDVINKIITQKALHEIKTHEVTKVTMEEITQTIAKVKWASNSRPMRFQP